MGKSRVTSERERDNNLHWCLIRNYKSIYSKQNDASYETITFLLKFLFFSVSLKNYFNLIENVLLPKLGKLINLYNFFLSDRNLCNLKMHYKCQIYFKIVEK